MPAPNSLTSQERVKRYLNIEDTKWDAVIDEEIDAVSQGIVDYCGRTFLAEDLTASIDGDGTAELQLRFPIISITSILNNGTAVVVTTNYEMYSDTGLVVLTDGTGWATGRKKIAVVYRYGYELDDLPRVIVSAATQWVCKKLDDIQNHRIGVSSVSVGDESISYEKGMPKEIQAMVNPYVLAIGGW